MRILELTELERTETCSSRDEEAVWDALGMLAPHLEDHLVLVESVRAFEGGVCNLTVCQARDPERTPLYVLASGDGQVRVGRTADLHRATSRYLDSFDPLWHGVLSVTASAFHRPVGDRLDLWIVVRPGSAEEADAPPVAYHGLIWVDEDGEPHLEPSLDDQNGEERRRWLPQGAEGLPSLLVCCNFTCPVGTDVLDGKAREVKAQVEEIENSHFDQIEAVTWTSLEPDKGEVLGVAVGGEVCLSVNGVSQWHELGERVRALALVGDPPLPARAVAASDARLLVGLEGWLGNVREDWRQPLQEFPVGVAFLPRDRGQCRGDWPDLLVVFHDGDLQRLRFVGQPRIRQAWSRAWRELGGGEAGPRIAAALAARDKKDLKRRQAAIFGAVEGMLEGAAGAEPELEATWAEAILDLFRPEESFRVLSRPLELLLGTFERWLRDEGEDWAFPAVLLYWIYTGQFYFAIQARIDEVLRSLSLSKAQQAHPAVKVLTERSAVNRNDVWSRAEPANPKEIVERSVFGLERWANAYLLADAARLEPSSLDAAPTGLAGLELPGTRELRVVCSGPRLLKAYRLRENGTLDLLDPAGHNLGREGIRSIVAVPSGEGTRLVVAGATGDLHLLAFDPESSSFTQLDHLSRQDSELGPHASAWAAACTLLGDDPILAVSYNERRQARVRLLSLEQDRLRHRAWLPLDIPRARALDVAADGAGGFLLAAGSYHAGPVRLLDLDGDGDGRERSPRRWFRVLKSGTLALRFSSSLRPTRLLAGERSGLLWCADLTQPSDVEDLAWTYHLGAAVRAIEVVDFDGEPHFLAGAENGRLVLLRARDGRRIWKHAMGHPVRRIRSVDAHGDRVVVGMTGQRVVLFSLVRDQKGTLDKVRGWFARLESRQEPSKASAEAPWRSSTAESVEAIFRLARQEEPVLSLLIRFSLRETRARVVRYLAHEIGPERLREDVRPILRALSLRELMLLLSCLPEAAQAWNEAVWDELSHRPLKSSGDDSARAGMAAVVVFLQRLHGEALESFLLDVQIWDEYLALPWVRLELARTVLRQVAKSLPSDRQRPADLLAATLPWLLRYPPAMVEACADALRYGAPPREAFVRLGVVVQALARKGIPTVEDVLALASALEDVARRDPLFTMMSSLASLFALCRKERSRSWIDWRREALGRLRDLERSLVGLARVRPPLTELVVPLRRWLPEPVPEDQESAAHHSTWLRAVRRHLDEPLPEPAEAAESPWETLLRYLAQETKAVLGWIVRLETEHIFLLVRPFLHLESLELQEGNKVELRLRMEPEGHRTLEDVTVHVDASVPGGLHGAGTSKAEVWVPRFPARGVGKALVLSGYLREGQDLVAVESRLIDCMGYRSGDRWVFQVPRNQVRRAGQISLETHLPRAFQAFVQAVVSSKAPVVLAAIDSDLGRGPFGEEWLRRTRGARVPLDDLLRDIGPGRRYSARALSLEILERCLHGLDPQEGGPWSLPPAHDPDAPPRPLLVAPADELLSRLFEGEAPGVLDTWIDSLRRRAATGGQPQFVLVLSSVHGARIRGLAVGDLAEVVAHRIVIDADGESLQAESVNLVKKETGLPEETARERLESLGWDLRLVLRWMRWLKGDAKRKNQAMARFLEETRAFEELKMELGALSPMRLIHTLVGADAVTTLALRDVKPGHVSAEDYFSTTKTSAPKLLQRRGEPFTERSLQGLQSDQSRIDRLCVHGFGLGSTTQTFRSNLLSLARHPDRKDQERGFESLSKLGIGGLVEGIFRTRSPYRELIHGLYDKAAGQPSSNPDEVVYGDLKGRERSPLESLSMTEVATIPHKQIVKLFQVGQREKGDEDLRRLQAIGRFWKTDHVEDVHTALVRLFSSQPVTRIEPQSGRWDESLSKLKWPLFGIGEFGEDATERYPQEYLLWSGLDSPVQFGDLPVIGDAVDMAVQRRKGNQTGESPRSYPRVMVLGPGAESAGYDPARRVAVLKSADLFHAAWADGLPAGILRRAKVQMRITALSPFQTSGALPAGSPLFVGREEDLAFIKAKIRSASILIIGSRRVGKTSLLNQVDLWAQSEPDLEPVFIDLQGCVTQQDFLRKLQRVAVAKGVEERVESLDDLAAATRRQGKLCVFLLNEIDGLLEKDPAFVASWRGLNDRQLARFIMVGYTAIGQIGFPTSPFFHFTEGRRFGGKAMVLDALSEPAARKLLDLLENSDVQARWATPRDREQAYRLCLERSYRIPWVLQRYGQLLVEHLERERKDTLSFQDVEAVLGNEGREVWKYIEEIDYKSLGLGPDASARRPGFQLVLYAVARQKYFLGGRQAPVLDARLAGRSPLAPELGFTIGEARDIVKETLSSLLRGRERAIVANWFENLDLERAFRLLTLTLMLEPDPDNDRRYGFLLHILPLELLREYGQRDPTLDGLIVRRAVEFMSSVMQAERTD